MILGRYCKEKLDACHSQGSKGEAIAENKPEKKIQALMRFNCMPPRHYLGPAIN